MIRHSRRRKYCRFTALGVSKIDYKDLDTLKDKAIRLEFSLVQAELFSFWFE